MNHSTPWQCSLMSSSINLLRSGAGIWLSTMGENLELGSGFRVLVVEERRRMES